MDVELTLNVIWDNKYMNDLIAFHGWYETIGNLSVLLFDIKAFIFVVIFECDYLNLFPHLLLCA